MIQSKVAMGGIGGAVAIILTWCLKVYGGIEPPTEVVQAFATLCGFVAGYLTRAHPKPIDLTEQVK